MRRAKSLQILPAKKRTLTFAAHCGDAIGQRKIAKAKEG